MGRASVPVAEDQPAVGAAARPGAETRYERIAIVRLGSLDDQAVPLPSHGSDGERFGAGRIAIPGEIGRASCRERVCQYGLFSVVAVHVNKKIYYSYK